MSEHQDFEKILANTQPKAHQDFQDTLENRLLSQLNESSRQKYQEYTMSTKQKNPSQRFSAVMIAAILGAIVIGGLLFIVQTNSSDLDTLASTEEIILQEMTEEDPITEIVIARRDIERGEIISEGMLTVVQFTDETDLRRMIGDIDNYWSTTDPIVGRRAMSYIEAFQPISEINTRLVEDSNCELCNTLRDDMFAVHVFVQDEYLGGIPLGTMVDLNMIVQLRPRNPDTGSQIFVDESSLPLNVIPDIFVQDVATGMEILSIETRDDETLVVLETTMVQARQISRVIDMEHAYFQITVHNPTYGITPYGEASTEGDNIAISYQLDDEFVIASVDCLTGSNVRHVYRFSSDEIEVAVADFVDSELVIEGIHRALYEIGSPCRSW